MLLGIHVYHAPPRNAQLSREQPDFPAYLEILKTQGMSMLWFGTLADESAWHGETVRDVTSVVGGVLESVVDIDS